ncbi:D-aminoacyl-tRNA deacylase [Macrococcus sp. CCM 2573]
MRVLVQRVKEASVKSGDYYGSVQKGLLLLVGIHEESTERDADALADKIVKSRIFEDDAGKMNLSVQDIAGEILSISQFTLYADVKKGNRPSFTKAMQPQKAEQIYHYFNTQLKNKGLKVVQGCFGEMMDIALINEGPVTIMYESKDGKLV